jgi:dTDP-4-dehydrorhamnose 3,5-epimerase
MIFEETILKGAYIIELEKIEDKRGFFSRVWCKREFEEKGLDSNLAQTNMSFNNLAGTLRGMHYQLAPFEEVKLVSCTRGRIYDVIIDLRQGSETFKQWVGVELTEDNHKMLYIPKNFAHGYQTLEHSSEIYYQVSQFYSPGSESGIRYNDLSFNIKWPLDVAVISDKDQSWPDYNNQA